MIDFHDLLPLPVDNDASIVKLLHPLINDGTVNRTVGINGVDGPLTDIVSNPAASFNEQSVPAMHSARNLLGINETLLPGTIVVDTDVTRIADELMKEHVDVANPLINDEQANDDDDILA